MEWTGLNELREKYLSFFESKGHLRLPSFSLVPQHDKSLLLINSGMAPMKKWFTGEETPPRKRVTTCQKCIRTPDIENVGKTARHGTYFEMLGNFSFGDYFKHEVIPWAWEFCTKVLEMDPEKLYISVYEDDDEAYDIWTKDIGVDPSHMVRFGKEDNFWEHGAGPCGPCSEIYYDRGEKYGCGKPDCKVGCECDRYIEFWNLVFTQFENDGNNNYSRLAHPNIDTGMGLERLACISQDVDNLFEVDTVQNIMKHIMKIAGVKYHDDEKKDISLRVITDHVRSTTMMISDGVMPSNEGRGYVLRRLLRRAARHGRLLGIDRPFLYEVAETVIKENDTAYPSLLEKHDFIINVIKAEEENFAKTIDTGLNMLEEMVKTTDGKVMSGADAFKLSDTYGFPLDLTKDILDEKGMTVDEQEYTALMTEARKKAREAHKDAGAEAWKSSGNATKGMDKTPFVGYETLSGDSEILAVVVDGEKKQAATEDDNITLVLSETPFYAESGGQVGDVGVIKGNGFEFTVENTTKTHEGVVLHHGYISDGETVSCGDKVHAEVNRSVREATMRNHTAAHLLQAALRKILGTHVEQAGQLVNSEAVRFDFTHFSALSAEELRKVENTVNEVIMSAVPVVTSEMPIDEAKKLGAMALFGEKYGDIVRVCTMGDSVEFCGGTHVHDTAEIGVFKIISESSVAAGVRRIEAATGMGVLELLDNAESVIGAVASEFKAAGQAEVVAKAQSVAKELKAQAREIESLQAQLANGKIKELFENTVTVKGIRYIHAVLKDTASDSLKTLGDQVKADAPDVVAVFAASNEGKASVLAVCGADAVKAGAHAGKLIKEITAQLGGKGGGRPDSAMGGVADLSKVEEVLSGVAGMLEGMLK